MGNENERKRDPAENRENRMGHKFDDVKTGGDEKTVGLTGDTAGGGGAGSVGSGGAIGGSETFATGDKSAPGGGQQAGHGSNGEPTASTDPAAGSEDQSQTKQVLTGDQGGDDNFSGQPQGGTSAIAANNSRDDLGASGAGSPGKQGSGSKEEPEIGPGGQSEIGGASDLGGGETGKGSGGFIGSDGEESDDYLERDGNPKGGFAERGRGAPEGSQPGGIEGDRERTANRDSDIEGSSTTR